MSANLLEDRPLPGFEPYEPTAKKNPSLLASPYTNPPAPQISVGEDLLDTPSALAPPPAPVGGIDVGASLLRNPTPTPTSVTAPAPAAMPARAPAVTPSEPAGELLDGFEPYVPGAPEPAPAAPGARTLPAAPASRQPSATPSTGFVPYEQLRAQNSAAAAPESPDEPNSFSRGFQTATHQLPELAGATVAFAGDVLQHLGADNVGQAMLDYGLGVYKEHEKDTQALSKDSDSFSYVMKHPEDMGSWLAYAGGYTSGQAVQSIAAMLIGAVAGSELPGAGNVAGAAVGLVARKTVERAVIKQAEKLMAEKVAKGVAAGAAKRLARKQAAKQVEKELAGKLGKDVAKQAVQGAVGRRVGRNVGAAVAAGALNESQELGSVYGAARQQAQLEGRTLDGGDLARIGVMATSAAGVDTLADMVNLSRFMNGTKLGSKADGAIKRRVKAGLREMAAGAAREGATEATQTVLERVGAGQDVASPQGVQDIVDSAALGVIGGSIAGAGAALHTQAGPDATEQESPELTDYRQNWEQAKDELGKRELDPDDDVTSENPEVAQRARAAVAVKHGITPEDLEADELPANVPPTASGAAASAPAVPFPDAEPGSLSDAANNIAANTPAPETAGPVSEAAPSPAANEATYPPARQQAFSDVPPQRPPWVDETTGEQREPTQRELTQTLAQHIVDRYYRAGDMRINTNRVADAWGVPQKTVNKARKAAMAMARQQVERDRTEQRAASAADLSNVEADNLTARARERDSQAADTTPESASEAGIAAPEPAAPAASNRPKSKTMAEGARKRGQSAAAAGEPRELPSWMRQDSIYAPEWFAGYDEQPATGPTNTDTEANEPSPAAVTQDVDAVTSAVEPVSEFPKPDANGIVTTQTLDGKTVHVRAADLAKNSEQIRTVSADGQRTSGRVHRANLDPTGAKRVAVADESTAAGVNDVITRKNGEPFNSRSAALRELNRRGLQKTHATAPASQFREGAEGFVVANRERLPAKAPTPAPATANRIDEGAPRPAEGWGTWFDDLPAQRRAKQMQDAHLSHADGSAYTENMKWRDLSLNDQRAIQEQFADASQARSAPAPAPATVKESVTVEPGGRVRAVKGKYKGQAGQVRRAGKDRVVIDLDSGQRVTLSPKTVTVESQEAAPESQMSGEDAWNRLTDAGKEAALKRGDARESLTASASFGELNETEQAAVGDAARAIVTKPNQPIERASNGVAIGDRVTVTPSSGPSAGKPYAATVTAIQTNAGGTLGRTQVKIATDDAKPDGRGTSWRALSEVTPMAVEESPTPDSTSDQFANNTLFTADKVEAARARLRNKLNNLNSGLDPEVLVDGMTIAGAYIEAGVRDFSAYATAMIADLGEGVKPYLLSFWEGARNYPGLATDGMTSADESASLNAGIIEGETTAEPTQAGNTDERQAGPDRSASPAGQGPVSPVRAKRGVGDDSAARPDSGDVAAEQPEDVRAAETSGDSQGNGVRVPGADVGSPGQVSEGGNAVSGRTRASRARASDAGTGDRGRVEESARKAGLEPIDDSADGRIHVRLPEYAYADASFKREGETWSASFVNAAHRETGDDLDFLMARAKAHLESVRDGDIAHVQDPASTSPGNPGPGNFVIDDPKEIAGGGQVARFKKNQAAIELTNTILNDQRKATREEQHVLAGFTGWGSFGQELFQGTWSRPMPKDGWQARDEWLREHLGQEQWEAAQNSIINAHYTDPPTVTAMWKMVQRMGFDGGRVLEPGMGIGNFFGLMPPEIAGRSQLAGIELDRITGSMAGLLYPDANIKVMSYADSRTPDNFHDLVIGNWPFANFEVADRRYRGLQPMLHDYFFLKAVDQTRPGGLVMGITSAGTMDKKGQRVRAALAKKAEFVTAIRLPSGAFQDYAGTKVVTDIVILRKRPEALAKVPDEAWINSAAFKTPTGPEVNINQFYIEHPDHVLGSIDYGHGTTSGREGMIVHRPADMQAALDKAVALVPENTYTRDDRTEHLSFVTNHTDDREGAVTEQDGKLYVVRGEHLAPAEEVRKYRVKSEATTKQREDQLRALIDMRSKYAALIEAERAGEAKTERTALRKAYEAFTKQYGTLSDSFGLKYLDRVRDPFFPELAALENDGQPATILSRSTTRGAPKIANPGIADAYVLARNQSVQPTPAEIAKMVGKTEAEVRKALIASGAVFEAPNGDMVPSDIYLGGNVRLKLREAQSARAEGNAAMARNVEALQKVVPADVPYFNIETQLGATWVPSSTYADYVAHMLNMPSADDIKATFINGRWKITLPPKANHRSEADTGFGTKFYPFSKLVNAAFTNQTVTIREKDHEGHEFVVKKATDEANDRIRDMREKFAEWLWSDPERRQALEREYNETRNAYATPHYDGSFLTFEGMALSLGRGPFNLREHQANAIWRGIVNRRSINAHEVGTGKTFTMGGLAVESRRYGIARKPMILAHNANSASVASEIQSMYPAAKVLYIDNLSKTTIQTKLRQIANDDWDAVVLPHSLIGHLAMREDTLMEMAREDIQSLEEEAYAAASEDNVELKKEMLEDMEELKKLRSVTAKELVKARNRIIQTIKKQAERASRPDAIAFEDLGVDMLLVDEVHEFKKPPISTRMSMKGLNTQTSDRSIALQFITRYIRANNFGGNVHTFTGTPITNTLTEIFHQMRYVMEDEMKQAGVDTWDAWFSSFAKEVQDVELSAAGDYETVNRLAAFINVPELRRMIGQYMDVVFADDMPEMTPREVDGKTIKSKSLTENERAQLLNGRTENATGRPYKKVINVTSDLTDAQERAFAQLQGYAREWRNMNGKARMEAMREGRPESPIVTEGLANKASFDARLLQDEALAGQEGTAPDDPGSKASKVVANVLDVYQSDPRTAQVVFSEMGYNPSTTRSAGRDADGNKLRKRVKTFATMRDIVERLVQGGIPREQIAIVDGSVSKERRAEIADAVNNLDIRVVVGSTKTLGVGVNMQRNLRAMHHMDAPYMPGELEQRNGRGQRQGNQWNTVLEFRYMTNRLDGRRWQILAIKQRFISAFMKANDQTRVIEGDAAADEESDILSSFSEAAGDPRILIRAKLQKKVESLQRAERIHGNGIADARRTYRRTEETLAKRQAQLDHMTADNLPERMHQMMREQSDGFQMTVDGKPYAERKNAIAAIEKFASNNLRVGERNVAVGQYRGHEVTANWPQLSDRPELVIDVAGETFRSESLRGLEQQIRNFPRRIEKVSQEIADLTASAARLKDVANAPFARADDLVRVQKQLTDLEADIQKNPVPPPAWLRTGAPVDSMAYRNDKPFEVTGHRWTDQGWFVIGQDDKGELVVPYMDVTDDQGMPLYEERAFQKPEVVENKKPEEQDEPAEPTGNFSLPAEVANEEEPFYSQALRTIEEAKGAPKKGTASAWKQWLDGAQKRGGIKKAEREWLGIDQWLDRQAGKVSREQLAQFVRDNQVQVQDVLLGGSLFPRQRDLALEIARRGFDIDDEGDGTYRLIHLDGTRVAFEDAPAAVRSLYNQWQALEDQSHGGTKFGDLILPGGSNYTELLMTLPRPLDTEAIRHIENLRDHGGQISHRQAAIRIQRIRDRNFHSSHFDQPNILAHVRFDERTDNDGKKVLFVEEIQSDWHQTGRKRGYNRKTTPEEVAQELYGRSYASMDTVERSAVDAEVEGRNEGTGGAAPRSSGVVPDAPFKRAQEWSMLAFKRMVRYAAEHGFDRVAWTTGEQQAERYDLSKQIDALRVLPAGKPSQVHVMVKRKGSSDFTRINDATSNVERARLPAVIGKDLAEKALTQLDADPAASVTFEGLDLKVGGEGMRAFYDKLLPNEVNKWAKPFGARVGDTTLNLTDMPASEFEKYDKNHPYRQKNYPDVHSLDITSDMKAAALGGLPLFRAGPAPDNSPAVAIKHLQRVNRWVRAATKGWGSNQPRVHVVHSAEMLPASAKRDPRYKRAQGYYDGRQVWIVAPNIHTQKQAVKTLTHESVGHYGVERIVADVLGQGAWDKIEASIERQRAKVREMQRSSGKLLTPEMNRVQRVIAEVEARYGADTPASTFAQETLAVMSEKGVNNNWLDAVVRALRTWLRQFMPDLRLSNAELRQLLVRSDAYLRSDAASETRATQAQVQAHMFARAPSVDTPAFRRWFKRSKVVNRDGTARVVFHGTAEDFPIFDEAMLGGATGHMSAPLGHFFDEDRAKAQRYAEKAAAGVPADENVMDVYLSIQHPKPMTTAELLDIDSQSEARALRNQLKAEGYDGIHLADVGQWVAFDSRQVKSASGNVGTFDANNPDIRFSLDDSAASRLSALEDMAPIPQPTVFDTLSSSALRARARDAFNDARAAGPVHMTDGADVRFSGRGWKEVNMHSADRRVLDIMPAIRALMEQAVPLWEVEAHDAARPNLMGYRNYGVKVSSPGGDYYVRFVVRMGKDGRFHYDHDATSVEAVQSKGPKHQPGRHPKPGEDAAGLAKNKLAQWITSVKAEQDASGGAAGADQSPTGNFSVPAESFNTLEKVVADTVDDSTAVARTKGWLAGKFENIKPALLGALQTRHLLELMEAHKPLAGAKDYATVFQRMETDRNLLLQGSPDAAENSDNMLAKGVSPIQNDWRSWAFEKGFKGMVGRKTAAAKELEAVMHDATQLGMDPSEGYEHIRIDDGTGKQVPWTKELLRERIKHLRSIARSNPGDGNADRMDEIKRLQRIPAQEKRREADWPDLKKRYEALPAAAKQTYREVRDWYRQHAEATEEALIDRIMAMDMPENYRHSVADRIRLQFEANRVSGVYFPLNRNGDFWISYTDKNGAQGFLMLESASELAKAENVIKRRGWSIEATGRKDATYKARKAPDGTFVKDVIQLMKQAGVSTSVQNDVYQSFLKTLPELSLRTHHIRRKGVPGYSADAMRAFAKNGFHGSYQLARLRWSQRLEQVLEGMQAKADAYRNADAVDDKDAPPAAETVKIDALLGELEKRHERIMNPIDSQLANKLTSIGFLYYLGASPASALVNLTQGAQVTLPVLGGAHGWTKAARVLGQTTSLALRTGGNIRKALKSEEEIQAMLALEKRGDIDRTQGHTLAAVAEGNELAANPQWERVMRGFSWMFHKAEVVNREAAGLAAFRLARSDGKSFNQAVRYASDIINGTQFDYSAANRPRYMQEGWQKVLLQFKSYSYGMTWLMYRNLYQAFKGESPEVRRVARRTLTGVLGMTGLLAGVVGLPIINLLALAANAAHALWGDDDEPWDFLTEFRAWLNEHFGETAGSIIAYGAADKLGATVSSRVSLSNLWIRDSYRDVEGRDAYHQLLEALAGPVGGILKNQYVGMQYVSEGHVWRGVEHMLPSFAKNGMKGFRYAAEGVNTLRGDPIVPDTHTYDDFLQVLGFQPTNVAEQWRLNDSLMTYQGQIKDRRKALMNAFAMSVSLKDVDARRDALRKIRDFNRHWPQLPITASTLRRSLRGRARYSEQAFHGMPINRRLRRQLQERVAPAATD